MTTNEEQWFQRNKAERTAKQNSSETIRRREFPRIFSGMLLNATVFGGGAGTVGYFVGAAFGAPEMGAAVGGLGGAAVGMGKHLWDSWFDMGRRNVK